MIYLVTGGAGFIGSNLVDHLLSLKDTKQVIVYDILSYCGIIDNVKHHFKDNRFHFVRGDICDAKSLSRWVEYVDFVFDLAASSHVDRSNIDSFKEEFVRTNTVGAYNVATLCTKHNKPLIHFSTDEVYGSMEEGQSADETFPLNPTSAYSAAKASADLLLLSLCKTDKAKIIITRCTNVFGPRQFPEKLIPFFIYNIINKRRLPIYGDGKQERSWYYVKDCCKAVHFLVKNGKYGEVYNLSHMPEQKITNIDLAYALLSEMHAPKTLIGQKSDRIAHDRRYSVKTDKIASLGYKPDTPLSDGLSSTIDWYLDNKWWLRLTTESEEFKDWMKRHYADFDFSSHNKLF